MAKAFDIVGYLGSGPGVADTSRGVSKSFSGKNAPKEMTPQESRADKFMGGGRFEKVAASNYKAQPMNKAGVAQAKQEAYRAAHAGSQAHASDVPAKGGGAPKGGGPVGNPNHDEHGRFTSG